MNKKYLMSISAILLISVVMAAASGNDKVRVIAHTDKEVTDAISQGCKVVLETKAIKALICSKDTASSLGLKEDIPMSAVDSVANKQIGATTVLSSGNDGTGRRIVVLDTGYNYNHAELRSSYLGGWDFVNNDSDPIDDNGHGSHVAGIITADGINSRAKGVAPGTGIISGKVLDKNGGGYFSSAIAGIYWAINGSDDIPNTADDFNADAISVSLGGSYVYRGFCDNVMPEMTEAIQYARDHGVIVVVAAGNKAGGVSIPGCISTSTTIGAVDASDNIASFSGRGKAVDLTAPGVSIFSSWKDTSYATLSGTSMATPMVSGTVALIKSAHPEYTVDQVQTALFNSAKDLGKTGKDTTYGWGRVNAEGAVNYLLP